MASDYNTAIIDEFRATGGHPGGASSERVSTARPNAAPSQSKSTHAIA